VTRAVVRANESVRLLDGRIMVASEERDVTISGLPNARNAYEFLSKLNATEPYQEIAARAKLPARIADTLVRLGLKHRFIKAVNGSERASQNAIVAAKLARGIFPEWKRKVFSHPLWRGLSTGELPRKVFVGWTLEHFHFIEGVTLRMPPAIAACRHRGVRQILSRHFREEYDHYRFFIDSLKKLGLDEDRVRASRPLPGTRAVLTWMRAAGERSWLSYACCSGFLESTGADRRVARAFLDSLRKHYDPTKVGSVEPIAKHVALDEDYGHGSFMEHVCEAGPTISSAELDRAFQDTYLLVETLQSWSTDILNHYTVVDPVRSVAARIRPYRRRP